MPNHVSLSSVFKNVGGGAVGELEDLTAFLAGGLNIGFEAPYPVAKLVVVTGLDAADDAIDVPGS